MMRRCAAFAAAASAAAASDWVTYPSTNAVDGCGETCSAPPDPRWRCLGHVTYLDDCASLCRASPSCAIATFSDATGNCWAREDGVWQPSDSASATTLCDASRVPACAPPPPYNSLNVTFTVGAAAGAPLHPLAPAVALDFWLSSDPTYGVKWGNSSILTIDLASAALRSYSAALAPALLRLGGSPEDSIVYDADGSCAPGGGAGPFPGYYCSQVHPYVYGCLAPARWQAVLEFADAVGFRIAFGLNGCWGRPNASAPMDFANARALMEATAASPHARALAYWELSNEVVPNTISAAQWVADAREIGALSAAIFGARGLPPPPVVGPDQGGQAIGEVVAALGGKADIAAIVYHQYPECTRPAAAPFALAPACLALLPAVARETAAAAAAVPNLAAWSGEGADHSGGGVAGLTDTFRSSFYYATQLGALPLAGVELMARQCLSGGDYELLQRAPGADFAPNPDFFIAWLARALFKQSARALNVTASAPPLASGLQIFAFEAAGGGTALLLINAHLNNTYYARPAAGTLAGARTEWHLTADLDAVHGPVAINGRVMAAGALPPVAALGVPGCCGNTIVLQPASIAFVVVQA
jgi:hypothetical protein